MPTALLARSRIRRARSFPFSSMASGIQPSKTVLFRASGGSAQMPCRLCGKQCRTKITCRCPSMRLRWRLHGLSEQNRPLLPAPAGVLIEGGREVWGDGRSLETPMSQYANIVTKQAGAHDIPSELDPDGEGFVYGGETPRC